MDRVKLLHSIPGHFKKVRARVRKEQSTFAKNLKDEQIMKDIASYIITLQ